MAKEEVKGCRLINKANHPVTIQYGGEELTVPAYARDFKLEDCTKLGELPKFIRVIKGE